MLRFTLPHAADFDPACNYAENLRQTSVAGQPALIPVGQPVVVAEKAGAHTCALPDGRLITVDTDHRRIRIDSVEVGTLDSDFRAATADGERIAVFTDAGVQWISAGKLQPAAADEIRVSLAVAPLSVSLSAPVDAPSPLRGNYPRLSGTLQDVDCKLFVSAFEQARKSLAAQAAIRGMLVGQARVGWRMLDANGRIVASGSPRSFGSEQTLTALTFSTVKSDSTFTVNGNPSISASAWTLNINVERADTDFWRRRARTLEILLWANCSEVSAVSGRFTETGSSSASLSVTPELSETAGATPVIAARFDLPLEGLESRIYFTNLGEYDASANPMVDDFIPSAICYGGTLRVYAPVGEQGVIAIARASDPLNICLRSRICDGRILRICVPAGTGGGWNYGRHHFLVFTTSGILAVSADSALKSVSASPVSMLGVSRTDAVTSATDCIYCATDGGIVLRLKGARAERVACPVKAVALLWVELFGELLVVDDTGAVTALTNMGLASRRSQRVLRSLVEPAMAVSAAGELVDFSREQAGALPVVWRRRVTASPKAPTPWRAATFFMDATMAAGLKLTISADNGAASQRLLELSVAGPVNAPLQVRYRAPRRSWLTFGVNGLLAAPARLVAIADSAIG